MLIFIAFHTYRVLYTRLLHRSLRCSTIRLSITPTSTPMESKVTRKNIQSVIRFSHLTPPGKCPPAKELRLPFVQQGDETCALKKHVMGQYSRPELITQEAALSYRMPRAHRTLDWAFAIYLRNKGRVPSASPYPPGIQSLVTKVSKCRPQAAMHASQIFEHISRQTADILP